MPVLTNYAVFEDTIKIFAKRTPLGQAIAVQFMYRSSGESAIIIPVPSIQDSNPKNGMPVHRRLPTCFFSDLGRTFPRRVENVRRNLEHQHMVGSELRYLASKSEIDKLKPLHRPLAQLDAYKNYGFFVASLPSTSGEIGIAAPYFMEFRTQLDGSKLFYPSAIIDAHSGRGTKITCDLYYQGDMRDPGDWESTHDLGYSMDVNRARGFIDDATAFKRTFSSKAMNSDVMF